MNAAVPSISIATAPTAVVAAAQQSGLGQAVVAARDRLIGHLEHLGDQAERRAAVELQGLQELHVKRVGHRISLTI